MHKEELALRHLDAFRANPATSDPRNIRVGRGPLALTQDLACDFLDDLSLPESAGGKGDSPGHVATCRSALEWWIARLGEGRDLRADLTSEVRLPVSAEIRGRRHKITTIKSLITRCVASARTAWRATRDRTSARW